MQGTRLEQFLKTRGIKPAHLARETAYTRQHLLRVRTGQMNPSPRCIAAIVAACRKLSGENVGVTDLFDGPVDTVARGAHKDS